MGLSSTGGVYVYDGVLIDEHRVETEKESRKGKSTIDVVVSG